MWKWMMVVCLCAGFAVTGCGEDSTSDSDAGGDGDSGDGDSGDGDSGDGDGDGDGNATGSVDSGMPMIVCDDTVESAASCGGVDCAAPSDQEAMRCQVSCCTADNTCGYKNSSPQAGMFGLADCQEPAVADDRCPGFGGGAGVGCCLPSGNCGVAFGSTGCFDISQMTMMEPVPCDGSDAGVE